MEKNFNSGDYTFVTACRNRLQNLKLVIGSWSEQQPSQIIIIDWGSDKKIRYDDFDISIRSIIKIYRFESDRWILSWAFNQGLSKVKTKFTVKLDCDHIVKKQFLEKNQCLKDSFIKANWRYASSEQAYINGAFICCSKLLKEVGFFNERIVTYGWDDSDLYERLFDHSFSYQTLDSRFIQHINQTEESRISNQKITIEAILSEKLNLKTTDFLIRKNENLVKLYDYQWNRGAFENSFERIEIQSNHPKHLLFSDIANLQTFLLLKKEINFKNFGKEQNTRDIVNEFIMILYKNFPDKYIPINLLIPDLIDQYLIAANKGDLVIENIVRYSLFCLIKNENLVEKNLLKLEKFKKKSINKSFIGYSKPKLKLILKPMH